MKDSKKVSIVLLLVFSIGSAEENNCGDLPALMTEMENCSDRAQTFLTDELATHTTDHRPDFVERKMCNFIEQIKLCLKRGVECFPDHAEELKAESRPALDDMVKDFPDFKTNKCPSFQWFMADSTLPTTTAPPDAYSSVYRLVPTSMLIVVVVISVFF